VIRITLITGKQSRSKGIGEP